MEIQDIVVILTLVVLLVTFVVVVLSLCFKACYEVISVIEREQLEFLHWVMDNCELADDNSLWTYLGQDYTNEGLLRVFNNLQDE